VEKLAHFLDYAQTITIDIDYFCSNPPSSADLQPLNGQDMLRFENVSVAAHGKILLQDLCFTISRGQKVAICGPSGAGKSTLLDTIIGVHAPSEGQIFFDNTLLNEHSVAHVRHALAYVGQEPPLGAETVKEALLLPFSYKSNRHNRPTTSRIEKLLHQLLLPSAILSQSTQSISGGEKQRIALCRALLLDKKVLLLDEVTSALDEQAKAAVAQLLFTPDITLLSISHDPWWNQHCDLVLQLDKGILTNHTLQKTSP
jgi:putative ABC transport system ATP-binding protein